MYLDSKRIASLCFVGRTVSEIKQLIESELRLIISEHKAHTVLISGRGEENGGRMRNWIKLFGNAGLFGTTGIFHL
jgi:hypothetical protein